MTCMKTRAKGITQAGLLDEIKKNYVGCGQDDSVNENAEIFILTTKKTPGRCLAANHSA